MQRQNNINNTTSSRNALPNIRIHDCIRFRIYGRCSWNVLDLVWQSFGKCCAFESIEINRSCYLQRHSAVWLHNSIYFNLSTFDFVLIFYIQAMLNITSYNFIINFIFHGPSYTRFYFRFRLSADLLKGEHEWFYFKWRWTKWMVEQIEAEILLNLDWNYDDYSL